MALAKLSELTTLAANGNYGIGAFSIANMEMILGAVQAAEETDTPIILQVAQARLPYSPLQIIGPMMLAAAKAAKVPVAVHLDHGQDAETALEALKLGFTSVMIDASLLPLQQNITKTREIAALARQYGADVEAEIGRLGIGEDGSVEGARLYTSPDEALEFYTQTGVDALAVSFGNAHGFYTTPPVLNFAILEEIHKRVPAPLVLHGGSGLTAQDFQNCIRHGVRKLNIATATFSATVQAAGQYLGQAKQPSYFDMNTAMRREICSTVGRHIHIFQNRPE